MKIFLSCVSSQFKPCRDALASDLRAVGAEVVVQEDFQQHGRTLLEKLEQSIATCDRVIALVGDVYGWEPDEAARPAGFPRRSYAQWEYGFAKGERLDGSHQPVKDIYLYFASPEFIAAHRVEQAEDAVQLQQAFVATLHASNKDYNLFSSLDQLRWLVLRDGFRLQQRGPQPCNLPYGSLGALFKGREQVLTEVAQHFEHASHQPLVVHGLGGMGKSRLAIEYAWRHQHEHTALFSVTADKPESMEQNLAALCAEEVLNLPEREAREVPTRYAAVLRWLDQHPGWLLILDNVDDRAAATAVQALLPRLQGGQVLITARFSEWSGAVAVHELHELEPPAAVAFLLERTQGRRALTANDEHDAQTLADTLGYLALALEQAGAFIGQKRIALSDYLDRWSKREAKVRQWNIEALTNYPHSALVTWDTSFDQLDAPAKALLNVLAWLAPAPVPRALLEGENAAAILAKAVALLSPTAEAGEAPSADVEDALAELEAFSLLQWESGNQSFRVHRLVQEVTRERLAPEARKPWLQAALTLVNDYLPGDPPPDDVRSWPLWEPMRPHVTAVAKAADEAGIAEPTSRLLNELGLLLKAKALWTVAEPLMRRALQIDEASFGPDHPNVAIDLNNLASLLQDTNRLAEAELLMRQALQIDEASFGPHHPDVAIDLNNLASLLQATNRLAEAEPLMRRALEIDEASLGPDHPNVARDLNNLAQLLGATNRVAEAEPLMVRVIVIFEKSLGENHPSVATALSNLAQLLQTTNRLTEAEPLMRRALKIDEAGFGSDHPDVAIDLNNLASLLQATNRLAEAEPLKRRALRIDEASLGPDHPDVARDLNNLAQLLQDTNRLAEAEPLMRRHLEIFLRFTVATGHPHPHLQAAIDNYAALLEAMGRSREEIRAALNRLMAPFGMQLNP